MKKKLLCFGMIIITLALALVGCANKGNDKTTLTIKEDSLNTVVFSDLCFDGTDSDKIREAMIRDVLIDSDNNDENKYGFIVVNGNLVDGVKNDVLMKKACDIIDSYGIPWAVSLGRKDVMGNASKKKIIEILTSYDNSYFMAGDTYGDANYAFDVIFNDNLVHTLYFLDTTEELTSQQVEWYTNIVKNKAEKYGEKVGQTESVISSLFMNNPFKEILPLVEDWKQEDNGNLPSYRDIVTMENENNLHKQIKALDSTHAIFFGNNPYTYFVREKNEIKYTICRNMFFTDDTKQKSLYGAISYTMKNSKYLNVASIAKNISDYK